MITFWTIPRPFKGEHAINQCNALASWRHLTPLPQILYIGNLWEFGIAATQLGVRALPCATNARGVPVLSSAMQVAHAAALHDIRACVNGDTVFCQDVMEAVRIVEARFPQFVMVGHRCDVVCKRLLPPDNPNWDGTLHKLATLGYRDNISAVDWFIYRGDIWPDMPPFLVGRTAYDNWMIWTAKYKGIPVIDCTTGLTMLHLWHEDRARTPEDLEEVTQNRLLYADKMGIVGHADWLLTPEGLRKK